jgi:hypothetical protein
MVSWFKAQSLATTTTTTLGWPAYRAQEGKAWQVPMKPQGVHGHPLPYSREWDDEIKVLSASQ